MAETCILKREARRNQSYKVFDVDKIISRDIIVACIFENCNELIHIGIQQEILIYLYKIFLFSTKRKTEYSLGIFVYNSRQVGRSSKTKGPGTVESSKIRVEHKHGVEIGISRTG